VLPGHDWLLVRQDGRLAFRSKAWIVFMLHGNPVFLLSHDRWVD
jgi:hypothetical protein